MSSRSNDHQSRVVANNCNDTFSMIILPAFKDVWDFRNKYVGSSVDSLKRVAQKLGSDCRRVESVYGSKGNQPSTAIFVYTMQSFVYPEMNKALREDNNEVIKLFAPYIYQLMDGLNKVGNYYGVVYRGIRMPQNLLEKYTKNTVFFWPGFTSSSTDPSVAKAFGGGNTIFEINIPKRFSYACADVGSLSAFKNEKEVLIRPYSCYRVLDKAYDIQLKKHVIKLIIEATCYNLSGVWTCHDTKHNVQNAGVYFIAQYGQKVFWFGKKENARWDFANVGFGTIRSCGSDEKEMDANSQYDALSLSWCDLPIANDRYNGKLELRVSDDYQKMSRISKDDVFWGDQWVKKTNLYLDSFELDINKTKWQSSDGYSGVWKGNDGSVYILSTVVISNVKHICWIAYDSSFLWTHIAFGIIENDKKINVDWGDLLIGMDRYHGTLECRIESKTSIVMVKSTPNGIFGTRRITKV